MSHLPKEIEAYFDRLWPICRSITGNGVRSTLDILHELIPLEQVEVPSGSQVHDWTVPDEWNIRSAYILTPDGRKVADLATNNLHVVSYSEPVDREVSYQELKQHVHTLPDQPSAIPYITSYYRRRWGFCMAQEEWDTLPQEGIYRVKIDATLEPGSLTYGHTVLPGETNEEVFFSTYVCHPSMANNELSGPLVQAFLYRAIAALPRRRFTYRFAFVPETIGALCYLAAHGHMLSERMRAGFVLTCCGDDGPFHFKRSRRGNTAADKAAEHYLRHRATGAVVRDFFPNGSDERQYCSPGYDLPVGSLMRTPYYEYPEYHTSLDNKSLVSFEAMAQTVDAYLSVVRILEADRLYTNTVRWGEPQLGKHGLYPSSLSPDASRRYIDDLLCILNFSDGKNSLLAIAERCGRYLPELVPIAEACLEKGVLTAGD